MSSEQWHVKALHLSFILSASKSFIAFFLVAMAQHRVITDKPIGKENKRPIHLSGGFEPNPTLHKDQNQNGHLKTVGPGPRASSDWRCLQYAAFDAAPKWPNHPGSAWLFYHKYLRYLRSLR